MRNLSFSEAIREAMIQEMERDSSVILMGEDVGRFNGAFNISHGMLEQFGPERVWDTPISEAGFTGIGIGAALTGMRPIIEFQYADFMFCAMDQIVNEAAKIRLMSGGQACAPLVIRAPQGAMGRAAQHSQSVEAYIAHTPGLFVAIPSTPYDAKGLLTTAIRLNDPVVFLEHKMLYGSTSPGGGKAISENVIQPIGMHVPEEQYTIPFGVADIKREGSDITIIASSLMVHRSLFAANDLLNENSISCEVIDLRTIVPLDLETITKSVKKTNHVIVVSEDVSRCGVASEIISIVNETVFDYLDSAALRISADNAPIPFNPSAEREVIPQIKDIKELVIKSLRN